MARGPTVAAGPEELAPVGRLMISYQEFGDPADEAILLIMGLGMQMVAWDEEFCIELAGRGFHVVRFDNRDAGLSSKLSGRVNLPAGMVGITGSARYDLDDMVEDTTGLMGHLDIRSAHLVDASMGGMIAQKLAATRPDRVRSLCSIMASTGKRKLSTTPRPDALRLLLRPPARSREEFIDGMDGLFAVIGSPGYPPDQERMRERAARSYDRCFYPAGTARQLMAIMASGDRSSEVAAIRAPSLVIHGDSDRLVPPQAGRDLAAAIPGAKLEIIEGMGHDLPPALWPRYIELIENNARAGGGQG